MNWIYSLIYKKKDKEIKNLQNEIQELIEELRIKNEQLENKEIETPKAYEQINFQETFTILKKYCTQLDVSNDYYKLTTIEEASKFLKIKGVYSKKWIQNVYDCDMFSRACWLYFNENLMQFAFGYARSSNHRFNVMLDKDKILWIYEPQTNEFFKYQDYLDGKTKKKSDYKITLLLI